MRTLFELPVGVLRNELGKRAGDVEHAQLAGKTDCAAFFDVACGRRIVD